MPVPAAILSKVSWIWMASSRVGLRINARMPCAAARLARRWIKGSTNASVLPVPVCAVATRSVPASAGSMAWACTGVGSVKPCLFEIALQESREGEFRESFHLVLFLRRRTGEPTTNEGREGLRIDFQ